VLVLALAEELRGRRRRDEVDPDVHDVAHRHNVGAFG
jgi:hypothetical protein